MHLQKTNSLVTALLRAFYAILPFDLDSSRTLISCCVFMFWYVVHSMTAPLAIRIAVATVGGEKLIIITPQEQVAATVNATAANRRRSRLFSVGHSFKIISSLHKRLS